MELGAGICLSCHLRTDNDLVFRQWVRVHGTTSRHIARRMKGRKNRKTRNGKRDRLPWSTYTADERERWKGGTDKGEREEVWENLVRNTKRTM